MRSITLITFILISFTSFSQNNHIVKYEHQKIDSLIQFYTSLSNNKKITVYRIQLDADESIEKIKKVKKRFLELSPNYTVEEIFEPPYFKAITGAYLDKKNAEKKIQNIKAIFPSSFIFQDQINIMEFKTQTRITN